MALSREQYRLSPVGPVSRCRRIYHGESGRTGENSQRSQGHSGNKGIVLMNHRIASACLLGRTLAATLAIAAATAFVAAPVSYAQAPKAKTKAAVQKPAPAKPAEPAPQPQAGAAPQQPQLMYTPWMKVCGKQNTNDPKSKSVCVITKDGRLENGMPVAVVQLFEPEGSDKKLLRVTVPLGMQLQHGTRIIIDQGQPENAPYSICFP